MSEEERLGSDVIVETLHALGIEHVALNPGASFRGLHDALVADGRIPLLLSLHEESCVAIAHGYAKAAGRPMAALVHNLVGLQHAAMAIYNAWVDGAPMLIVGGAGPADTSRRRPWLDWIHTPTSQNSIVRDYVKWDSIPTSLGATTDALLRAHQLATSAPMGPTYVAIDAEVQESPAAGLSAPSQPLPVNRIGVDPEVVRRFAHALAGAQRPVVVADATCGDAATYDCLQALAEALACEVVDLGARHNFPNRHPNDATDRREEVLAAADVALVLDPRDLAFAICAVDARSREWQPLVRPSAQVLVLGLNLLLHRGFLEREPVVPGADIAVAETTVALPMLLEEVRRLGVPGRDERWGRLQERSARRSWPDVRELIKGASVITPRILAAAVWAAVGHGPYLLAFPAFRDHVRATWDLALPGAVLGGSGGAGLGYGPGAAVGAGLATQHDGTLVVSLQPDGDLLYAPTALWTAARHRIPFLMVVENNRSYGADRLHQERVAARRGRVDHPVGTGIDIDDPAVDIASLAQSLGVEAFGPVSDPSELGGVLARAEGIVRTERRPVLVDVLVERPTLVRPER